MKVERILDEFYFYWNCFLITAIIIGIIGSALDFVAFAMGFVIGLGLLIYAGAKYN